MLLCILRQFTALPRIVTLHDFTVEAKQDTEKNLIFQSLIIMVKSKTLYRYVGADEQTNSDTVAALKQVVINLHLLRGQSNEPL